MKTSTKRSRRRYSAAVKAEILQAHAQREVSQQEFCRQRGLGVTTLQYWLRQGAIAAGKPAVKFIELKAPPPPAAWSLMLELPGNLVLKATGESDPRWLGAVVAALRCGA